MQHNQAAGIIVALFIALGILGVLSAIALPHAKQMAYQSKAVERDTEFLKIQHAVTEMLRESPSGLLRSIGPTADMSKVLTADGEPLVLVDYLPASKGRVFPSGCRYSFTADGTVLQFIK